MGRPAARHDEGWRTRRELRAGFLVQVQETAQPHAGFAGLASCTVRRRGRPPRSERFLKREHAAAWLSAVLCGPSLLALAKVFVLRKSDPNDMKILGKAAGGPRPAA